MFSHKSGEGTDPFRNLEHTIPIMYKMKRDMYLK